MDPLREHGITLVVDVRSQPYSRWATQFNRETLARGEVTYLSRGLQSLMQIELTKVVYSSHQVRTIFTDEELRGLAESIKENGLLQPIKVRPTDQGYELVYGHRRVAAMRLLGWTRCEAIVEEIDDDSSLVQSLAENLQRQNLDIIDEACSYEMLVERGYPLREIAELVNKPQGRISNRLSILRLPPQVQELVRVRTGQHVTTTEQGGLSPDSASRIASVARTPDEAIALAQKALDENLNSREIRELTGLLKRALSPSEREQIVHTLWRITDKQGDDKPSGENLAVRQNEPFGQLVHRKTVWNLRRLDLEQFDHFTIGYSERSLDQFIELLRLARVDLVADVRSVPISRFRPEFSKSNLAEALIEQGIEYVHWPELGIPTENRRSLRLADLFDWYDTHVQPGVRLTQHTAELSDRRIAFMCVEVDPQSCHRHRIATCLERIGLRLLDL